MKKLIFAVVLFAAMIFLNPTSAMALECREGSGGVSLSPTSDDFSFSAGDVHEGSIKIKNINSSAPASFKVYAAPYSIDENNEKDFTTEKARTQISRWIEFDGPDGYTNEAVFEVAACSELEVSYRVVVPGSIPDGGQYAVVFVEGMGGEGGSGIRAISRAGMLLYGRASGGETIENAEISDLKIETSDNATDKDGQPINKTIIKASAVVNNTGNVDVAVTSDLKIENIFGSELYHHANYDSALPDGSTKVSEVWSETPLIGLFKVTYTVSAPGGGEQTVTRIILLCPIWAGLIAAVMLIIVIIGIMSMIDKRRKRKAKYGF